MEGRISDKCSKVNDLKYTIQELITCPISRMIFLDPVTARDGIVYERKVIESWFNEKNTSPITSNKIKSNLVPAYLIKNITEEFIKHYPELLKDRYIPPKLAHIENIHTISLILEVGDYNELFKYDNFVIKGLMTYKWCFNELLLRAPLEILKYIIDNLQSHEEINQNDIAFTIVKSERAELLDYLIEKGLVLTNRDKLGKTILHYICEKYYISTINLVKNEIITSKITSNIGISCIHYIIKNKCILDTEKAAFLENFIELDDLEIANTKSKRPIHYACERAGFNTINYLINKNVNLDIADDSNTFPIHYLIENENINDQDKILLLGKFKNLEHVNDIGQRPIHLACNFTVDKHDTVIKYLIDRKVELNCPDDDNWNPIHYLCNETPYISMIVYLLMKNVDLECKTNKGEKPIHLLAKPSTLSVLKLLANSGAQLDDLVLQ